MRRTKVVRSASRFRSLYVVAFVSLALILLIVSHHLVALDERAGAIASRAKADSTSPLARGTSVEPRSDDTTTLLENRASSPEPKLATSPPPETVLQRNSVEKRPFVIAFCRYKQSLRVHYPNRQAEFMARYLGPHIFPDREIVYKPVVAVPEDLPDAQNVTSATALELLGITGVDLRICFFGSTEIIRFMSEVTHATSKFHEVALPAPHGWTHNRRIYWPSFVHLLVDRKTLRPLKPFLIRENIEPWHQESRGVGVQFEAKREESTLPHHTVSMFQPHMMNSFGRRLAPNPGEPTAIWTRIAHGADGPFPESTDVLLRREPEFDARKELAWKKYFAAFVNSHCWSPSERSDRGGHYTAGVIIRESFAYALAQINPVNTYGACPKEDRSPGATARLGMTISERKRLSSLYHDWGTVQLFNLHKFVIVFENSGTLGYLSEKLVNGWLAKSVPIYFGADKATLDETVNPRAYVHCDLPSAYADESRLNTRIQHFCHANKTKGATCLRNFQGFFEHTIFPHFEPCLKRVRELDADDEAYARVISESFFPDGVFTGVFNRSLSGELVRVVYQRLGFDF